jgi:hypothetical protein
MPMSRFSKGPTRVSLLSAEEDAIIVKRRQAIPHEFVLDAIAPLSPWTRPMFGCLAVYVEEKIVLALRDETNHVADNGVWLATTEDHHESLRREFPNMRSISVLGERVTGWQVLPSDAPDFEEAALRASELVLARDPRIGKISGVRKTSVRKSAKRHKPERGATSRKSAAVKKSKKR